MSWLRGAAVPRLGFDAVIVDLATPIPVLGRPYPPSSHFGRLARLRPAGLHGRAGRQPVFDPDHAPGRIISTIRPGAVTPYHARAHLSPGIRPGTPAHRAHLFAVPSTALLRRFLDQ